MKSFYSLDIFKLSTCASVAFPKGPSSLSFIGGPGLAKLVASPAVLQFLRLPVLKMTEQSIWWKCCLWRWDNRK